MKIVFKKDDDSQISVFQNIDGQEKIFSYVDMIKSLIDSNEMEKPEISVGFTEPEIKSINSMVTCINDEISTIKKSDPPA